MRYYLDLLLDRPLGQQIMLLLGMVLLLAALDYVLVYRPQAHGIGRTTAALELAHLEEARLRRELARLPQLREELAGLRRGLRSRLPPSTEPSSLLESVAVRAAAAGLEVIRVHPGEAVEGEHFTEHPVTVELEGSFHDLLTFLGGSSGPSRLTTPRNLVIEAADAEDGHTVLRIALDMATLRFPALEEAGDTPVDGDQAARKGDRGVESVEVKTLPLPRRDPFQPYRVLEPPDPDGLPEPEAAPVPPPDPDPVPRFRAVGIVWQHRAAVALVRDGEGYGHVVQRGSRLAGRRIRVKAVTPCEVVLETARPGAEPGETRLAVPRCHWPQATGGPAGE